MASMKALVEAYIFASHGPLSVDRLCQLLECSRSEIRTVLSDLIHDYELGQRGFRLYHVAGGYQFRTDPQLGPALRKLSKEKSIRFSPAALETLAIIAYRQPITRAEIEYLRGVDSGGVVKSLLERNLLRILGKKDVPGRPLLYGTSRQFLEFFSLKDLGDLPTLKEFASLDSEIVEADPLPPEEEG